MEEKDVDSMQLERLRVMNDQLIDAIVGLDPKDPDYFEDLETLTKLQKEVATDFKNYAEACDRTWKNEIEVSKNEIEAQRNRDDKKSDLFRNIVAAVGSVAGIGGLIFNFWSENRRNKRFEIANKFEEEDAYRKTSDRKAVDEGLKESHFKWFNK